MNGYKKSFGVLGLMSLMLVVTIGYRLMTERDGLLMEIIYLNVGQGDATLLLTPEGKKFLIDVSSGPQILEALSQELGFFEKTIEGVFLTHMDADHVAGLVPVLEYYEVKNIFISKQFDKESLYQDLIEYIEEEDIEITIWQIDGRNQVVLSEEKEIIADILFPIENYPFKDRNDRSMVMQIMYDETRFLFTGDASTEIEDYLVQNIGAELPSAILQVGHHGSNTSSSEHFLKAVRSEYAIISAGEENDFGHPHLEVVERIQNLGIQILETKEGNQRFVTDGRVVLSR